MPIQWISPGNVPPFQRVDDGPLDILLAADQHHDVADGLLHAALGQVAVSIAHEPGALGLLFLRADVPLVVE